MGFKQVHKVSILGEPDREEIKCREETEQDPGEWEQAAEWGEVREAENPAVWADPARQDRQAPAYARSADKGNHINVVFHVWIENAPNAGLG